jgi:hypothetical protein
MSRSWFENMAEDDFARARTRELLSRISGLLDPDSENLLPFEDVKAILKPAGETYIGMEAIPVDRIVGSEGRYRDFNRHFLPRKEFLRSRWISVDMAHYKDVLLPPVRIYELGGVYFVRDGNHRVSVARMQGQMMIDAEVTKLDTVIDIKPLSTLEDLRREVVAYEKKNFYEKTDYGRVTGDKDLDFTSPGRYDQVIEHILVHKYYVNQSVQGEIAFADALWSWHENVYKPVIMAIREEGLVSRFPGRTASDLYMFLVQHWDELKHKYGLGYSLGEAARDYGARYGSSPFSRFRKSASAALRRASEAIGSRLKPLRGASPERPKESEDFSESE